MVAGIGEMRNISTVLVGSLDRMDLFVCRSVDLRMLNWIFQEREV
jgi:hypothetical protein